MKKNTPKIGVDILVIKDNQILLGLLSKKWLVNGVRVYGVPCRDIPFGEKIGDTVKRDIQEDIGCNVISYKIFSINASHTTDNHFINIGIVRHQRGKIESFHHILRLPTTKLVDFSRQLVIQGKKTYELSHIR